MPFTVGGPGPSAQASDQLQLGGTPWPAGRLEGARILVVDDDLACQYLLEIWLEAAHMQVVRKSNGQEALDHLLGGEGVDAVLMDVSMPVLSGLAATRQLRRLGLAATGEQSRYLAALPIVGVSGHALEAGQAACLAAGMNACLVKPLTRAVVLALLAQLVPPTRTRPPAIAAASA